MFNRLKQSLRRSRPSSLSGASRPRPRFSKRVFFQSRRVVALAGLALLVMMVPVAIWQLTAPSRQAQAAWYNEAWQFRKKITTNPAQVAGGSDLTDFPVLISITDPDLAKYAQTSGNDLVFTDSAGTKLSHDIDEYNSTTGALIAWVKVTSLSTSVGTDLYLYYGNPLAANQESTATWTNYGGVWHLAETVGNGGTLTDSTSNANNGSFVDANSNATTGTTAKVGKGILNGTGGDYITVPDAANGSLDFVAAEDFSVSMWVNATSSTVATFFSKINASTGYYIYSHGSSANTWFAQLLESGSVAGSTFTNSNITSSTWQYLTFGFDRDGSLTVYRNGVAETTMSISGGSAYNLSNSGALQLMAFAASNRFFTGTYDELRLYRGLRSTDWITTEYNNQNSPSSFITLSATEDNSDDSLNLWWKLDDAQGQVLQDSATNNEDGVLGTNSSSNSEDPTWVPEPDCALGTCLRFDGTDDQIQSDSQVFNPSGGNFSVSLWANVTSFANQDVDGDDMIFLQQLDGSGTGRALLFSERSSSTVYRLASNLGGTQTTGTKVNLLSQRQQWVHLALTYSGTTLRLYINGIEEASATRTAESATGALRLARAQTPGTTAEELNGLLDEFKVYGTALTAAQVQSEFNLGAVQIGRREQNYLTEGLVAYYRLNETSGTAITDNSGNGNTLMAHDANSGNGDGTTVPSIGGGVYDRARTFDGTDDLLCSDTNGDTTCDNDTDFSFTGAITVSAWVRRPGSVSTNPAMVAKGTGAAVGNPFWLDYSIGGGSVWRFGVADGTSTTIATATVTSGEANRWYHVVGSFDPVTRAVRVYENGQLMRELTSTFSTRTTNATPFTIGGFSGGSNAWTGQIDEVRIYNKALSPQEINNLYLYAPGPVGEWLLNENTGSTAADTSGSGFNGTTSGTTWTVGRVGDAQAFIGGEDDYITMGDVLDFDHDKSFSISAWIYPTQTSTPIDVIVSKQGSSSPFTGWKLDHQNNDLRFNYVTTVTSNELLAVTTTDVLPAPNRWYHVTVSYDNENVVFYVNGVAHAATKSTDTLSSSVNTTTPLNIGNRNNGPDLAEDFNGTIDEVRIYNYALTRQQVMTDYNSTHPIGGSPIGSQTSYWPLDENTGTTANNRISSASAITGSISGAAWRAPASCEINSCLEFDGSDDVVTITNAPTIDLNNNLAAAFTTTAWVYVDTDGEGDVGQIWQKGSTTYLRVDSQSGGRVDLEASLDLATTDATVNIASALATGTWHHVAMQYVDDADDEVVVYINGILRGRSTNGVGAPAAESSNLLIGGTTTANFDGRIDEFKIYNSELTAEQIEIDMNGGASQNIGVTALTEASTLVSGAGSPPVSEWRLDQNTGTSAQDTSGNNRTGTLTNGPTWRPGKIGAAVNFDGSDDFIDVGSGPGTVNTVSFWVNPTTTTEYPIDLNGTAYVWINAGTVTAQGFTSPTIYVNGRVASTVLAGRWSHVLVTTGSSLNASDFDIGRIEGVGNHEGLVDQVRLFDYALNASQAAYDFNRGGPLAAWRMDECQGTTINDISGNGVNGTLVVGASGTQTAVGTCGTSGTAWGNGATGKFNSSLNFDGTDDYVSATLSGTALTETTVALWIRPGSTQTTQRGFFQWANALGSANPFILLARETNATNLKFYVDGNYRLTTPTVANGEWAHVVVTLNSSDLWSFYINGQLRGTYQDDSTHTNQANAQTAYFGNGFNGYFNGQTDDGAVYGYALSAAQVRQLYNQGAAVRYGPSTGSP